MQPQTERAAQRIAANPNDPKAQYEVCEAVVKHRVSVLLFYFYLSLPVSVVWQWLDIPLYE